MFFGRRTQTISGAWKFNEKIYKQFTKKLTKIEIWEVKIINKYQKLTWILSKK